MYATRSMLMASALIVALADSSPLDLCAIKLEPIGCYKEKYNDKAMENEILNARQPAKSTYAGYQINWREWTAYLPKFICQCAKLAHSKGYRTMGIQFYGTCWGSMRGHVDYKKHGKAETCVHGEKGKAWGRCKKGVDVVCSGEALTNFVYRVAPTACDTYYEPGGCFKDNQNKPRPLPDYLMNERDYSTKNWNGHLINWRNWNTYSPQMICRCAQKAKQKGKKTFAIQFYGECWTGDESKLAVARDGVSKECLAEDFLPCPYNSYHCVGKDHANRVYRIKQTPPAARPWNNPKGTAIVSVKKK